MIDIASKINAAAQEIADDVVENTREQAKTILELAKEKAPEQTGALKRSLRSVDVKDGSRVEVGVDYAATVHENPASNGHKFLENAAKELAPELADRVADGVRDA